MPIHPQPRHRASPLLHLTAALAAVTLIAPLLAAGCAADHSAAPVTTYEVRGEITRLPGSDETGGQRVVYIRHEAIDEFVGIDGDVVGMNSMTMPFPVSDADELNGLAVGDKIAFSLEVQWEGDPPYRIRRIEKLPADTELVFRSAEPGS